MSNQTKGLLQFLPPLKWWVSLQYYHELQSKIIGASIDITSDTIKLSQEYNTLCDICALK